MPETFPITEEQFYAWLETKLDQPIGKTDNIHKGICPLAYACEEIVDQNIKIGFLKFSLDHVNWQDIPEWAMIVRRAADMGGGLWHHIKGSVLTTRINHLKSMMD